MIHKIKGLCQYKGCRKKAVEIASGRETYIENDPGHPTPALYCEDHAAIVSDEQFPEYIVECPNCQCKFGVG